MKWFLYKIDIKNFIFKMICEMKNEWKQFVNDEYCHKGSNDTFNLVCNKYAKTLKTAAVSEQQICNILNAI